MLLPYLRRKTSIVATAFCQTLLNTVEQSLEQVRAVEKARLAKKLGALSTKTLLGTVGTLQEPRSGV